MAAIVGVLLPASILLEVVPVQQSDIGLPVKNDLNNVGGPGIKFILKKVHNSNSLGF